MYISIISSTDNLSKKLFNVTSSTSASFKRIEVDAYFVEKANIALAAYKMFDTEDRNYMAKVIPFFRQMDASNNAELKEGQQKVERVFTDDQVLL